MDAAFKRYKSRCDPLNFKDPKILHKFEDDGECHALERYPGFFHFSKIHNVEFDTILEAEEDDF